MSSLQRRRTFIRNLSMGSLGLLAAACAPAAAPAPTTAPTRAAAPTAVPASSGTSGSVPKSNVTITVQHGSDVTTNKLYTSVFLPGYQQLHPNVTIQHEAVPNVEQKLLVEFATNAAPTMFEANANTLQALMSKGVLSAVPPEVWSATSVEGMLSKYYMPKVMNVLTRDGQLYGIPNQMNASSRMINTRLFAAAGLDPLKDAPKTWDAVAALTPNLTIRYSARQITHKAVEFVWP